jgi:hypothetical protein
MARGRRAAVAALAALAALTALAPPAQAEDEPVVVVLAAGGLALAATGIGVGLIAASAAASANADDLGDELYAKGYAAPCRAEPATCDDIERSLLDSDDERNGAIASFAIAGVLVVGTVIYVIEKATGKEIGGNGRPSTAFEVRW